MATWSLFTRDHAAEATGGIPAAKVAATIARIATGKFTAATPWTPDRMERLTPGCGLIIRRDGHTVLSGVWNRLSYVGATAQYPLGTIELEGVTDDVIGQYRLCLPDPTRPLDQQTTAATWTRTGPVESLMHALVGENCGPAALAPSSIWPGTHDRRIPGLVMGADRGRGPVVTWSALRYATVQDELRRLAAYAEVRGVRLLPRFHHTDLGLTFDVTAADDRTGLVVFGPGLGNLDVAEYTIQAGTVGVAAAAGKGEGAGRLQRVLVTEDEFTRAFGALPETYIDRRDTDDVAELDKAAREAVDQGVAAVSFRGSALDTPGTRYGVDFDLNTLATVTVRPPGVDPATGQRWPLIAQFDDLVREISFQRGDDGVDKVMAAIGHEGVSTGVPLPSVKKLAAVSAQLAQLQRSL